MAAPVDTHASWPAPGNGAPCDECGTPVTGASCATCGEQPGAWGLLGWTPGPSGVDFDPFAAAVPPGRCPGCGRTQCSGPSCPTRGGR